MLKQLSTYYRLFTLGLIILLICPSLIQDGMFMDGQQYACVSMNLADGYGSWWFPYLSDSWWKAGSPHFMEHPPLVYWLQAGFFKVLGNGMYTERIYSFVTALIMAFLIHKTWKKTFKEHQEMQKMSMLPIICWIITPLVFWGYQHNVQENTMGIFSLLAVYLFLIGMDKKGAAPYLWFLLSSISISLAFLAKGLPGIFPLATILMYFFAYRNISMKWMLFNSFFIFICVISFFLIITIVPAALESLSFYINERLLYRIESEGVVTNRFAVLLRLFMEILPAIGLGAVAVLLSLGLKLKVENWLSNKKHIVFFLLMGLSASVPLMLTDVQRGFYLLPAFPFFALAIACFTAPLILQLKKRLSSEKHYLTIVRITSIGLFLLSITLTLINYGGVRRDEAVLHDVHLMSEEIPRRSTISASGDLYEQWNLKFYFMRYHGVSIDVASSKKYLIVKKDADVQMTMPYRKLNLDSREYDLWVQTEQSNNVHF